MRTKKHLSTVLEVTGERPPVLLVADKFTYQHWSAVMPIIVRLPFLSGRDRLLAV